MTIEVFRDGNGSAVFTCVDCGSAVYSAVYAHPDCICLPCQFIRENPDLSKTTKRRLRGDQS